MAFINIPSNGSDDWQGALATAGDLPASGQLGETRLVLDTGTIYYYDGASWQTTAVGGGGITSLNGENAAAQTFAEGTTGSDFNISSAAGVHTFNIPNADSAVRGVISTGVQNLAGNKTFDNDVIVAGDLTVNGTTTTINTTNLEVTDQNILINNGGNDASSEGAGLTIERTGTSGSFIYEDALSSKFKIGSLGFEIEIANISSNQTLTNKTIDLDNNTLSNIEVDNFKVGVLDTDLSSVSASDDTLASAKSIKAYVDNVSQYKPEAVITVSAGDSVAKSVSLVETPSEPTKARLFVIGGPIQEYSVDYTISGSTLSWNGLGLDGIIETGDKLLVTYN